MINSEGGDIFQSSTTMSLKEEDFLKNPIRGRIFRIPNQISSEK